MNGFILICILFCGVIGIGESSIRTRRGSEITLESVSNASRSASDAVNTAHQLVDIKKQFDAIRNANGKKPSGTKRTRRGSEITAESLADASKSASDAVNTAHQIIDIKREFDDLKKGKSSGSKRTRRGSEITLESVSNASRSASDAVNTAHQLVEIKKEFDTLRNGRKPSGTKRTRRSSEIIAESLADVSKSASDAINTAHQIIDIKREFDDLKKGKSSGSKRTRRGSEITLESVSNASRSASDAVNTAHQLIDIKREFDQIRKGKSETGNKRTRRGSEITAESLADASKSASNAVKTVNQIIDIKNEFDEIRKGKPVSKRTRRGSFGDAVTEDAGSTVNKLTSGLSALLKTQVYQRIARGNFQESTVRGYTMFDTNEGKFVFGTLDGELKQSFRSIMKDGNPRTGDIISCMIPTSIKILPRAEHYMMVINKKIAEVFVVGGKSSDNGVIGIDSYLKSSYINSTECLHHRNRFILRAEQIDEKNGNDKESDARYQEMFERLECTVNSKTPGKFEYDLWSCNCQDLVLYWAYGYAENKCAEKIGCIKFSRTLYQIAAYVDEHKEINKPPEEYSSSIVIGK